MLAKYMFLRKRFEKPKYKKMELFFESKERSIFPICKNIPKIYHSHSNSKEFHKNYHKCIFLRNTKNNFAKLSRKYFAFAPSTKETPIIVANNLKQWNISDLSNLSMISNKSKIPNISNLTFLSHSKKNSNKIYDFNEINEINQINYLNHRNHVNCMKHKYNNEHTVAEKKSLNFQDSKKNLPTKKRKKILQDRNFNFNFHFNIIGYNLRTPCNPCSPWNHWKNYLSNEELLKYKSKIDKIDKIDKIGRIHKMHKIYNNSDFPIFQNKIINEMNNSIYNQFRNKNKNNSTEFYRNVYQKIGKFAIENSKISEIESYRKRKKFDYHKISSVYRNLSNEKTCYKTSYSDSKNNYSIIFQNWGKKTINTQNG